MHQFPQIGENGVPGRGHKEYVPQYIQGLGLILARNLDFSGNTMEDTEHSTDEVIASRRRHPCKEIAGGGRS